MKINDFILYQDDSLIVINKPSGLITIPDGYDPTKENLSSMLKEDFPEIMTVHRLDKETSGVIVFARSKEVHRNLNLQFENRKVKKKYAAITHNIPDWSDFTCKLFLKVDGDRYHRTIVKESGKPSETYFVKSSENRSMNISLIDVFPHTGYTHQIRSHLYYLGFPILGDQLYSKNLNEGQKKLNKNISRMMLHAESIELIHPVSGSPLFVVSEIPFSLSSI